MIPLYPFQKSGVERGLKQRGLLFLTPMGSGKTRMALAVALKRHQRGQVDRVFVVCQKTLVEQWKEVIVELIPSANVLKSMAEQQDGLSFYVINYEVARRLLKEVRKAKFDMIVVDECHKLKKHSSMQSRRLWLCSKRIPYRLGLTGTPIEGNEIDFWAQIRFVDPTIFGDTWSDFKKEWCDPTGYMGKKSKLRRSLRPDYLARIAEVSYIVSDEEALGLPPAMDIVLRSSMTAEHRRIYQGMERELIASLPDGVEIDAQLAITQLMKLRQIAGGFVYDGDKEVHIVGDSKLQSLRDLLEGHPAPIVIYAAFIPEIEAIERLVVSLGRKPSIITGKRVTGSPKQFDVLICQIAIVAGLDGIQHVTNEAVFYSKDHSRIHYEQARSRVRRDGQKNRVRFYTLATKGTVDIDLELALQGKGDVVSSVVKYLLKRKEPFMAKTHTPAEAGEGKVKEEKTKEKKAKKEKAAAFDIGFLAAQLGKTQHLIRIALRKHGIPKNAGRYVWDHEHEALAVVQKLQEAGTAPRGRPRKEAEPAAAADAE